MDETARCKRLWAAVLLQAIVDAKSKDPIIKKGARYWLNSNGIEFNSFINICTILKINSKNIRKQLKGWNYDVATYMIEYDPTYGGTQRKNSRIKRGY